MSKYRLAFVGLGRVADVHYDSVMALHDRVELAAVCDVREQAVQQRSAQWNVAGFTSFSQLLQQVELDAVCLLLPHHVHLEYVTQAAEHGLPVFLEKPIAATLDDAREDHLGLRRARGDPDGRPQWPVSPGVRADGGIRQEGLARPTPVCQVYVRRLAGIPPLGLPAEQEGDGRRLLDRRRGHLVYCLREIFGKVAEVSGYIAKVSRPEMEGEDLATVNLRYESGALANLVVSYGIKLPGYQLDWPQGYEQSIEVYGDKGAITYTISPEPQLKYFSEVPEAMPANWSGWLSHKPAEPYTSSFRREMEHFIDCLDTGGRPGSRARTPSRSWKCCGRYTIGSVAAFVRRAIGWPLSDK